MRLEDYKELTLLPALKHFLLVSISDIPWRCGTNTQSVTAATRSYEENVGSSLVKNSFLVSRDFSKEMNSALHITLICVKNKYAYCK